MDDRQSILSHGEREIAALRRAGHSVEEIATERGDSPAVVEKALDRIDAKTRRALATLLQSPVTDAAVADLDPDERAELRDRLDHPE
jgi:DNA-binding CsgD family transcriptional regulator